MPSNTDCIRLVNFWHIWHEIKPRCGLHEANNNAEKYTDRMFGIAMEFFPSLSNGTNQLIIDILWIVLFSSLKNMKLSREREKKWRLTSISGGMASHLDLFELSAVFQSIFSPHTFEHSWPHRNIARPEICYIVSANKSINGRWAFFRAWVVPLPDSLSLWGLSWFPAAGTYLLSL